MDPNHIRAMWDTYRITLTRLNAFQEHPNGQLVKLIEAEISGIEQLLDCFSARYHIDAVRKEYQLAPRVWLQPERRGK